MDTSSPTDSPPPPQEQKSPAKKARTAKPTQKWTPPLKKKWSWLAIFFDFALFLVALLLGAGWFLTSDYGARKVVFPRLSRNLGIEIQAKQFHWKIFSGIYVEGFCLGPRSDPIFSVERMGIKYDGKALLRRELIAQEVFLESPRFQWADHSGESPQGGKSNEGVAPPPPPVNVRLPPEQDSSGFHTGPFRKIEVSILQIKNLEAAFQSAGKVVKVQNFKLSARDLKPGGAGSLDLKGDFSVQAAQSPAVTGTLQSQLDFHLDDHLLPVTANGQFSCDGLNGKIADEPLEGLSIMASVDLSQGPQGGSFLKKGEITVRKGAIPLTTLSATGPLNFSQREADLDLQAGPIGANVLDVFFANRGIKFQDTSLDCVGHYSLKEAGKKLSFNGTFNANPLNLNIPELPDGAWKPLVLSSEVAMEADLGRKTGLISKLNVEAAQQGQPFLKGTLASPMAISWGKQTSLESSPMQDSTFTVQVSPFDLTPWLALLHLGNGMTLDSATLGSNLKIVATDKGHRLSMDGELNLSKMVGAVGQARFTDGSGWARGKASLKDLKSFHWALSKVQLREKGEPLLDGTLDGAWEFSDGTGAAIFKGGGPLKELLALGPPSHLAVDAGYLGIGLNIKREKGGRFSCKTNFSAKDLDLAYPPLRYQKFNLVLEGIANWDAPNFQYHDLHAKADFDGKPACDWSSQFSYNVKTGNLSLKVFLDPASTTQNVLQASGTLKNSGNQVIADLKVSGKSLDLGPFYEQFFADRIVPLPPASPDKPAPAQSAAPTAPSETPVQGPPTPPGPSSDIQVLADVDSFKVHDLVISNLKIPFHYRNSSFELNDALCKIGTAPVTAKVLPQKGSPAYQVEAKMDGVQIGPIADTFLPDQKGEIGGTITADFTGTETPQAGWMKGLHGDFHMAVRDAHLQKLPAVQSMLKELGNTLQSPEIASSTVENLDASAALADEKLNTDNFHAAGSAIEASLRGDLFLDQRISMEAGLKIKKEVMSHSSLLAPLVQVISSENGDWIKLPTALVITGTLGKPQMSVNKEKLVGNTLLNTGENLLKDFLKSKQKNNPSNPTNSQPQQSSPQDQSNPVQDLLNGLFKKKK